ncbi:hypothetical protein Bhyg_01515, partial [Pseudolycoriella hygida]
LRKKCDLCLVFDEQNVSERYTSFSNGVCLKKLYQKRTLVIFQMNETNQSLRFSKTMLCLLEKAISSTWLIKTLEENLTSLPAGMENFFYYSLTTEKHLLKLLFCDWRDTQNINPIRIFWYLESIVYFNTLHGLKQVFTINVKADAIIE